MLWKANLTLLWLLLMGVVARAESLHFVTEEFPPFTFSNQLGQPSGAVVEMVLSACAQLKYQCLIEVMPWRRALSLAEAGDVDGIFTVINAPERSQHFHISRMLVTSHYDLYSSPKSRFNYQSASDLSDRRIGVYGPSGTQLILHRALAGVKEQSIELVANNQRLLLMLEVGRFGDDGVVVLNRDVARYLIEQEQLVNVRLSGELGKVSYGIGFSRKRLDEQRFQAFNQVLASLMESGDFGEIAQRYGVSLATP